MNRIKRGTTVYNKVSFAFFAAGFNTFAILYCVQPLMEEFTTEFHISPTMASLSLSVTTLLLAISMIVFGTLSEAWGRKKIMGFSMLVASILCLITAWSPNFEVLLALRTLQGIALAGLPSIAMAYLGEEIEQKSLGAAMGLYISGNAIGAVFGRVVAGLTGQYFGWHTAIGVIGICSILATVVFFYSLPDSKNFTPKPLRVKSLGGSLVGHLRNTKLLKVFIIGCLLLGSNVALFNYIIYVLLGPHYDINESWVSWIFLVLLVGVFSSTFIGNMVDKYGFKKIFIVNILLVLAGALLTLAEPLVLIVIGIALFTFGFFASHSIASSLVGKRTKTHKAQASSLYLFFYYAGSSVFGALGGVFWGEMGWKGVVGMVSIMLLITLALAISIVKEKNVLVNT